MRIYVGNLAEQTTEDEIRATFAPYGQVSRVAISKDKQTGLPRGYGIVEMLQSEEAEHAVAELHGTLLRNKALRIREARTTRPDRKEGRQSRTDGQS